MWVNLTFLLLMLLSIDLSFLHVFFFFLQSLYLFLNLLCHMICSSETRVREDRDRSGMGFDDPDDRYVSPYQG